MIHFDTELQQHVWETIQTAQDKIKFAEGVFWIDVYRALDKAKIPDKYINIEIGLDS